jgi:hypothetical protein
MAAAITAIWLMRTRLGRFAAPLSFRFPVGGQHSTLSSSVVRVADRHLSHLR